MRIARWFLRKVSWQTIVLLVSILLIGLPSFFVGWMIIDDGYYLLVEQNVSHFVSSLDFWNAWNNLIENEGGRFRPGLRLYLWLTYVIAGENPVLHHFLNFLISAAIVILIYLIVQKITSSKSAALISSLLFLLAPFNIENWYRLKTPEPKITFFIAISILLLVQGLKRLDKNGLFGKRFFFFAIVSLIFAYFIREISFAFIPFSLFLVSGAILLKTKKGKWVKWTGIFALLNIIFGLFPFVINLLWKQPGLYTGYYQLSSRNILINGWNYIKLLAYSLEPFSFVLGISFFTSCFILIIKKKRITLERFLQISFFAGFLSFLIVLSPWMLPMGRYLETAFFFLVLVFGVEAHMIVNEHLWFYRFLRGKVVLFFVLGFMLLGFNNLPPMFNYIKDTIAGQAVINETLSFIAKNASKDTRVFWNAKKNEATTEPLMESNLLIDLVYERSDITVDFLDSDNMKHLREGDWVMTAFTHPSDVVFAENELKKESGLRLVKEIRHRVATIGFPSLSFINLFRSTLKLSPAIYSGSFYQTESKTNWQIYIFKPGSG